MSDDWKPGDLALCVRSDRDYCPVGSVHTVTGVVVSEIGRLGLTFVDVAPRNGKRAFVAARFRKINPLNEAERAAAMRELNAPARENV